jgi:hypothetical protein
MNAAAPPRRPATTLVAPHTALAGPSRPVTSRFPRSMENHSSTVVRRDVVPQPTFAIGLVSGPFVTRRIGKRISENLVN